MKIFLDKLLNGVYNQNISNPTGYTKGENKMNLEKLGRGYYDEQNQDFTKCEELWSPIDADKVQRFVKSNQETLTLTRPGEDVSFLDWENVEKALDNGRVIELMMMFVRKQTDLDKCPLCGSSIEEEVGSLSRRDNQTYICSICGENEARDDYYGLRS